MKHNYFYKSLGLAVLAMAMSAQGWADTWTIAGQAYESTLKEQSTVAEGIVHKLYVLGGPSNMEVQVVEVDMTSDKVDITTNKAQAGSRVNDDPYSFKTVGAQAQEVKARGLKPVMGMNADFFLTTGNLSHQMVNGTFTRFGNLTQKKDRPRWYMTQHRTFGMTQYTVRPTMTIYRGGASEGETIKEPGTLYNSVAVNAAANAPTMQIFTPAAGRTTGSEMKEVYADLVEGYLGLDGVARFKILDSCTDDAHLNNNGSDGNSALDEHYVIAGTKDFGNEIITGLTPGDIVEFAFPAKDNFNETGVADTDLKELIGGSLRLLVDGEVQNLTTKDQDGKPAQTGYTDGNPTGLEPRAGIGYTTDNSRFFMVIVDGRRAGAAEGCTMAAFADIMLNIGAENALNLDGGGSATLYNTLSGEVCNWPTDGMNWSAGIKGGMRSVPNSLWVVSVDDSGVDSVLGDADVNAPVEFYNLQGVRVANPATGLYIRRQGTKASKVLIR